MVNGDESYLVVCENGFGKRSNVEEFRQTNRGGVGVRSIITSERNGNVVGALCVTDNDGMVMMSSTGQTVRISMRDVRVMGRNTQGVKLANLRENDYLVAIQKLEGADQANGGEEGQDGVDSQAFTPPPPPEPGDEIEIPEEEIVDETDER